MPGSYAADVSCVIVSLATVVNYSALPLCHRLHNASVAIMRQIIRSMLQFVTTETRIVSEGPETKLFVVIDEALDRLKEHSDRYAPHSS